VKFGRCEVLCQGVEVFAAKLQSANVLMTRMEGVATGANVAFG